MTWPMPMPTVAEPLASTIAFDFTARHAFQAKMRFGHLVIGGPLARDELPVARHGFDVVGEPVGVLQQQAARDEPHVHALLLPVGRELAARAGSS